MGQQKAMANFPSGQPQQLVGDFHTIPLDNHYDMVYVGRVIVGSGPKKKHFKALFDSGSSDVWFVSTHCSSEFCEGREGYHLDGSSARHASRISISYAAGKVHGYSARDKIRLRDVVAKNQGFVAASTVTISKFFNFDGIIGMSPRITGARTGVSTFLENLTTQKQFRSPIFSFILYDYDDSSHKSYMILGGIDHDLYDDELQWVDNNNLYFWSLPVTHVSFGHTFGRAKGSAIIDSGTSYIFCPERILEGMHHLIGAKPGKDEPFWTVDCSNIPRMPKFTLVIDDEFEVPLYPSDYTYKIGSICYSAFLPMEHENDDPKNPDWILGAAFLRSYYVAFDMENSQIGIARYKHRKEA